MTISRRHLLALAVAGFVTACGPASHGTSTPMPIQPRATPTAASTPLLLPTQRIQMSNVGQVKQLATLDTGGFEVNSLAWSPDARFLAAGAYRDLHIWDATAGKQVTRLQGIRTRSGGLPMDPIWFNSFH